jgi:predicted GNAT family N-acyltransferase
MVIEIIRALPGSAALQACFKLRLDVFVTEQNVPAEEELDTLDDVAVHVLVLHEGAPAATARAVEKAPGQWKIGRVAVAAAFRKHGLGKIVMQGIEEACPASAFMLDAQTHAIGFYEKLGYVAEGPEFLDAGIPHRLMRKPARTG